MRSMVEGRSLGEKKPLHHAASRRGPPPLEIEGRIRCIAILKHLC